MVARVIWQTHHLVVKQAAVAVPCAIIAHGILVKFYVLF